MNTELIVFDTPTMNTMFGPIRYRLIEKDVWFLRNDCLEILGMSKDSGNRHRLDTGGWQVLPFLTSGGAQKAVFINEANFYRLVCRSNKPKAREFEKEVFNVILPTIRKTGKFSAVPEFPQLPPPSEDLKAMVASNEGRLELIIALVSEQKALILHSKQLEEKNDELSKLNQAMLPAFNWVEKIREAGVMWDYTEASAVMAIKGLGPIQLREYLEKNNWIYDRESRSNQNRKSQGKKPRYDWTPYSEIVQSGWMKKDLRIYDHSSNANLPSFINDYMPAVLLIDGMLKLVDLLKEDGYVSTVKQHQEKAKQIIEWAIGKIGKAA